MEKRVKKVVRKNSYLRLHAPSGIHKKNAGSVYEAKRERQNVLSFSGMVGRSGRRRRARQALLNSKGLEKGGQKPTRDKLKGAILPHNRVWRDRGLVVKGGSKRTLGNAEFGVKIKKIE